MPKLPYAPHHLTAKQSPTARFGGDYITFRKDLFVADLSRVVEITINKVGELLVKRAQDNLRAIQFHNFPVKFAGEAVPHVGIRRTKAGYTRTDASRKHAVINSIVLGQLHKKANSKMSLAVQTMANNFKDSHIGIYYEHGTGPYAEGFTRVSGARYDANPLRSGSDIYTRPGDEWTDLGGNKRISYAGSLRKLHGFAVKPQRWFERAVQYANSQFPEIFSEKFKSMNITKYLQIKPQIVIGGRRK